MKVLVTGHAGFIGSALTLRLLQRGDAVIGIDNVNDYYDPSLKKARLARHTNYSAYSDLRIDITDKKAIENVFRTCQPQRVVNLAAQAGVRYSLINPHAYIETNINGFINILEGCRKTNVEHLVFASSSSVYGGNKKLPFNEHDNVDHPVSLYAATKKANELMAHTYSHLYELSTVGLRFFTVYGPWGRPDMAPILFTKAILENRPINIFNNGNMARDFTYIDDVIEGLIRVIDKTIESDLSEENGTDNFASNAPYRIFNVGNSKPVNLLEFIKYIENALGKTATKKFLSMQPGDIPATIADTDELYSWIGYKPNTPICTGLKNMVQWYQEFNTIKYNAPVSFNTI